MNHPVFDLPAERWTRLRTLLDAAMALDEAARQRWLAGLAGSDVELRPRLAALLSHHDEGASQDVLGELPAVETADFAGPTPREGAAAADRVGPYRLLRELGSGGMASVWLAERTDMLHTRQVALKLPHGAWRRAGLADRLQREREILATLEHPHIARLYDAGLADDGQPWLALEYVQGQRIDEHCRAQQLGVPARLRLVLQVAAAVAHAHARLVVHRDLKPANILVDGQGQVKLLDFGIAKLLESDGDAVSTELTERAGRPLTLHYASPEQLAGRPLGTASDIHALGVLLYELLAGVHPFGRPGDTRAAIEQAVLHHEPPPPSHAAQGRALRRALLGDLDTIVLKALKKDPAARYATVAALIDDIERHLERRPVLARPDSRGYRLRRFVARHAGAVGAGATIALVVVAGTATALWQAHQARVQQQRAEQVKTFIASIFTDADPFRGPQERLSVKELLERARTRLDGAALDDPALRVELQTVLAGSLLGQQEAAAGESLLAQAVDNATRTLGADHPLTLRAEVLRLQTPSVRRDRSVMARAIDVLLPRLQRQGAALAPEWVSVLISRAAVENDEGRYQDLLATVDEALAVADRHRLPDPSEQRLLAYRMRSNAYTNLRRMPEALHQAQASLAMAQAMYPPPSRHPTLIDSRFVYGRTLADAGRFEEGRRLIEQAIADTVAVLGRDNHRIATLERTLVRALVGLGDLPAARAAADSALASLSARLPPDAIALAYGWVAKASVHAAAREPAEAASCYARALTIIDKVQGPRAPYAQSVRMSSLVQRAHAGEPATLAEAELLLREMTAARHPRLLSARADFGELLRAVGQPDRALMLWEQLQTDIESDGSATLAARARNEAQLARAALAKVVGQGPP
jgi:serine/threonine-protein kinase